jgi:hypothetical protein
MSKDPLSSVDFKPGEVKKACSKEPDGCSRCKYEDIECHYSEQKHMGRPRKRRGIEMKRRHTAVAPLDVEVLEYQGENFPVDPFLSKLVHCLRSENWLFLRIMDDVEGQVQRAGMILLSGILVPVISTCRWTLELSIRGFYSLVYQKNRFLQYIYIYIYIYLM